MQVSKWFQERRHLLGLPGVHALQQLHERGVLLPGRRRRRVRRMRVRGVAAQAGGRRRLACGRRRGARAGVRRARLRGRLGGLRARLRARPSQLTFPFVGHSEWCFGHEHIGSACVLGGQTCKGVRALHAVLQVSLQCGHPSSYGWQECCEGAIARGRRANRRGGRRCRIGRARRKHGCAADRAVLLALQPRPAPSTT